MPSVIASRPPRLELLRRVHERLDRPLHDAEGFRLHLAGAVALALAEQRRLADRADAELSAALTALAGDPALADDLRPIVLSLLGDAAVDPAPGRGGRFADFVFLIKELLPVIIELVKLFQGK